MEAFIDNARKIARAAFTQRKVVLNFFPEIVDDSASYDTWNPIEEILWSLENQDGKRETFSLTTNALNAWAKMAERYQKIFGWLETYSAPVEEEDFNLKLGHELKAFEAIREWSGGKITVVRDDGVLKSLISASGEVFPIPEKEIPLIESILSKCD